MTRLLVLATLVFATSCGADGVTVDTNNSASTNNSVANNADADAGVDVDLTQTDASDQEVGEPPTYDGPTCVGEATGTLCGGEGVLNADPDTLYTCDGPGPAGLGQQCGSGCVAEEAADHHCEQDVAVCDDDAKTGYYCAGDKVSGGTQGTLYFCDGPGMAVASEVCERGCVVAPAGYDDHCASAGATCDADASTGDYCGGDKVSGGETNVLYRCNGPGTATVKQTCSNGCVVAPAGSDDYCAPTPVTCDANAGTGFYCAGDKVTGGAANTLYKCNGPGTATKVEKCDTRCVVAPAGQDDYCEVPAGSSSNGYRLPFKCNTSYRCSNGNNTSTHTGTDRYAYDFAMPVGTSVRAIRDGVVHRVRIVSRPGSACYNGGGSSCANYANTVEVKHSDGTIALYMHINSASVSQGQRVTQGQEVAKSGNTGWSTGPHLHLQVQSNCGIWWCQSKPFSFAEKATISSGTTVTSKNNCP